METFVARGGTLLVEGLTAFFDEDLHNTMNTGFTFEKLFGGNISEFILKDNLFDVKANGHTLPTHLWYGHIAGQQDAVGVHTFGKGQVIWLPSTVALGAFVSGDYRPLSDYLVSVLPHSTSAISFDKHYSNMLMRTLKAGKETLVICINKSERQENVLLNNLPETKNRKIIYANTGCNITGDKLMMSPEGVLVVQL